MAISMEFVKRARAVAILPVVGVALAACGGNKVEGTESATVAAVPGGGAVVVETFSSSATVSALNTKDRKVTLEFEKVNAVVSEQAVIWLSKNGGPPASAAAAGAVLAPVGAKPGGIAVATMAVTATVTAIDAAKGKVTLQFDTGKPQVYKLGKGANLAGLNVGDQVNAVVTEGVAMTVTKA